MIYFKKNQLNLMDNAMQRKEKNCSLVICLLIVNLSPIDEFQSFSYFSLC